MRFTKKSDYALRLMESLARSKNMDPVAIRSVCGDSGMAVKFMQSVVSDLSKAGLVKTKSGPRGGVLLTREPGQINLLQIVEAVEGKINLMDCLDHPQECQDYCGCSIMTALYSAQDALVERLKSWNLKLMTTAKSDPFQRVPVEHYQHPLQSCPAIK